MNYAHPHALKSVLDWLMPPPPVRIDFAEPGETAVLAAIHAASFRQEWGEHDLDALIGEPQVICLVARRANAFGTRRPIGFILLRLAADEAEVLTIAVDPRRRGRGYGRALLTVGIDRLIRRGVTTLFLEVDEDNQPAVSLYRRLGFGKVGERKGYYRSASGPAATALVMRLNLE